MLFRRIWALIKPSSPSKRSDNSGLVSVPPHTEDDLPGKASRRAFWQVAAATAGALWSPAVLSAQTSLPKGSGAQLDEFETFEAPVVDMPPLNVPVLWQRRHTASGPAGSTHGIVALVAEATGTNSFPWPFYVQLTTSHNLGDAVGSYVRLTQTGTGWGASYHTDLYADGGGTSIGSNIEVTKSEGSGIAIGINLQSKGLTTDHAINIQTAPDDPPAGPEYKGAWATGLHFDKGTIGGRAVWIEGTWSTGIDLGSNSLAMESGSKIFLDTQRQIYLSFNRAKERIEFCNGQRVVFFITVGAITD